MRNIIMAFFFIMVGLHCWSGVIGVAFGDSIQLEQEIERLKAAESAWKINDAEFRKMRDRGEASQTEIREFAEFVAELKRNVIEECEIVRNLGGDMSRHNVCVQMFDSREINGGIVSYDAYDLSAPVDKSDLYEEELRKLENDFDDILMNAQDELQKKKKVDVASGAQGGNDISGKDISRHADKDARSEAGGGVKGKAGASKGREGSEGRGKTGREAGSEIGAVMADQETGTEYPEGKDKKQGIDQRETGDSSDDDVVARQLREAAEEETDPVLKEQLWKEYEKYKKSRQ